MKDVRNVKSGEIIVHKGPLHWDESDIIAIYGQNGSGKTTVVDAFSVLQHLMRGDALPSEAESLISVGASAAELVFRFVAEGYSGVKQQDYVQWEVSYEVTLARSDRQNVYVSNERVRGKQIQPASENTRIYDWFVSREVSTRYPVMPERLWNALGVCTQDKKRELSASQVIASHEGRSFLFSPYFLQLVEGANMYNPEAAILESLHDYAMRALFVVNKVHTGLIYTNITLPLSFRHAYYDGLRRSGSSGTHLLTLNEQDSLRTEWFSDLDRLLAELNTVLDTLIPGFSLKAHVLSPYLSRQSEELTAFELVAVREGVEIPLRYESNGVRRLVSVLSLLMAVYNDPSVCVVIDELDAGIFEYLLGQLIDILAQSGQGQLIFTSHNLRILEMLRPQQIVVTTTDPEKRFAKLKNIKPSNNTRNKYYEFIEGDDTYYSGRGRNIVERAFQKASESWEQSQRRQYSS